jgi:F-type H+-transporting ATPase subunit delta
LPQVREELADFVQTANEVPELHALLRNPQLEPAAKTAILGELLGDSDQLIRNFLRLLAEKGRIGEVDEIGREFERLSAEEEGVLNVELTTAVELSDDDAKAIVEQIESASGRTVEATRKVDPDLVGGIVLEVGSLRLDASVRGRLERLRRELVTRS